MTNQPTRNQAHRVAQQLSILERELLGHRQTQPRRSAADAQRYLDVLGEIDYIRFTYEHGLNTHATETRLQKLLQQWPTSQEHNTANFGVKQAVSKKFN